MRNNSGVNSTPKTRRNSSMHAKILLTGSMSMPCQRRKRILKSKKKNCPKWLTRSRASCIRIKVQELEEMIRLHMTSCDLALCSVAYWNILELGANKFCVLRSM